MKDRTSNMEKPLSEKDKLFIRENFDGLYNNITLPPLIDLLIKKNQVLTEKDIASLTSDKLTDEKKLVYVVFNILMRRGTYGDVISLRQCLVETDQSEATRYLSDVIMEEEEVDCKEDQPVENGVDEQEEDTVDGFFGKAIDHIQRKTSSKCISEDDEEIVKAAGTPTYFSGENTKEPPTVSSEDDELSDSDDYEIVKSAGKGSTAAASAPDRSSSGFSIGKLTKKLASPFSKKKQNKNKDEGSSHSESDSDRFDGRNVIEDDDGVQWKSNLLTVKKPTLLRRIDSFTDAFIHYETKDPNSQFGCGLCLIISLFTGDLTGYIKDRGSLIAFFGGLNYEIKSYENLTKAQMFKKIEETQKYIEEKKTFDRLAVVVLTHGKQDGLMTCADDSGIIEEQIEVEDSEGKVTHVPVKTKVEEIVSCFKHDKVPSLKDMPKFFLIQACRGDNVVKAAHRTSKGQDEIPVDDDNGIDLTFKDKSPIDADIIVCCATTEDHPSMVNPHTGSWFIQQTLKVFQKHYDSHHLLDMMTVVNLSVAELRGKLQKDDGKFYLALQIPCIVSTLRRQFFLDNPTVRYSLHHSRSDTNIPRSSMRNHHTGSTLFG